MFGFEGKPEIVFISYNLFVRPLNFPKIKEYTFGVCVAFESYLVRTPTTRKFLVILNCVRLLTILNGAFFKINIILGFSVTQAVSIFLSMYCNDILLKMVENQIKLPFGR